MRKGVAIWGRAAAGRESKSNVDLSPMALNFEFQSAFDRCFLTELISGLKSLVDIEYDK